MMKLILLGVISSYLSFGQGWMPFTAFPGTGRDDGVAVAIGHKAYVGSGLTSGWTYGADFYCYDMAAQSWSAIASMPAGTERQYACAFPGGNSFFVFGGDGIGGTLNSLYEYNTITNSWSQKSPKPGQGIYGASCFAFGDSIILTGGRFSGNFISHEVWMYRISSDSWQQLGNVPQEFGGRWRAAYATLFGKGYLLFGLDGNNAWRKELLEYNPQLDSWNKIMDVNHFPSLAYATMQNSGAGLLVFGGMDSLGNYSGKLHYFELSTYTWSQGPPFTGIARRGGMSWMYDHQFYYTCGLDQNEQRKNESWSLGIVTSSKEQNEVRTFTIGPNPFSSTINISSKESGTFKLYDTMGQLQLHLELVAHTETQEFVQYLKPGLYTAICQQGQNRVEIKKLVKY